MNEKRVLLIDDDESNVMTMEALLEDEGFFVASAGALDEATKRLQEEAGIDLVVLDYHLGSDNGLELLPEIRRHHPCAKVVVMSGFAITEETPGVDAVALKGEHFDQFLDMIHRLLPSKLDKG